MDMINKGSLRIYGYASIFNTPDSSGDIILPSCFSSYLGDKSGLTVGGRFSSLLVSSSATSLLSASNLREVALLAHHLHQSPIGKIRGMKSTDTGLYICADIFPYNGEARDLIDGIDCKVINGLSIGFLPRLTYPASSSLGTKACCSFSRGTRSSVCRKVASLELLEISVVSIPMHKDARIIISHFIDE